MRGRVVVLYLEDGIKWRRMKKEGRRYSLLHRERFRPFLPISIPWWNYEEVGSVSVWNRYPGISSFGTEIRLVSILVESKTTLGSKTRKINSFSVSVLWFFWCQFIASDMLKLHVFQSPRVEHRCLQKGFFYIIWLYAIVCGCMWLYVAVCDCRWLYVVVCGCMWLYVTVCGCIWLYDVSFDALHTPTYTRIHSQAIKCNLKFMQFRNVL